MFFRMETEGVSVISSALPPSISTGTLKIADIRREAESVLLFTLVHPEDRPLSDWQPGAHIQLVLPSGLVRQYSLCGDSVDPTAYQIAVLRQHNGRGGSNEFHKVATVGDVIEFRGPYNHFPFKAAASVLFVAGGIGITPILPMIRHAMLSGSRWELVYGGRSRTTMAFLQTLEKISSSYGRVRLHFQDEAGLPDLNAIVGATTPETAIYACGPEGMLQSIREACRLHGRDASLHIERFTAAGDRQEKTSSTSFEVELARSGQVVHVPADRSILEVLRDIVPDVMFVCEQGYCGTCEQTVLGGVPDHRDVVLTEEEKLAGKKILICVSRALSTRLALDI